MPAADAADFQRVLISVIGSITKDHLHKNQTTFDRHPLPLSCCNHLICAPQYVIKCERDDMPDLRNDKLSGSEFEASVRHVSRQLYSNANTSGSINLDGRERDEVIDTGTELIIVEATQSRKLDKVEYDFKKSVELVSYLRKQQSYQDYNFRIMLVTAEDPTADQNEYVRKAKAGCPKEIVSFTQLFSRLFDARHYIRLRGDYAFGSVRNPANEDDIQVPQEDYIPTALNDSGSGKTLKATELAVEVVSGGRHILYGDYGSGKSMTLRDVYFRVRDIFTSSRTLRCPIYINLRDHTAQTQPDEALFRHAEKIGFPNPYSLIAAWRAGLVTLFLDGFDELTPPQFTSSVYTLRQARRFAVELVRRFVEQTPQTAGVIVAGRESYFDVRSEAQGALGYNEYAHVYDLAGFTENDILQFLKATSSNLPAWLPTRPLLLGYLANTGLLRTDDQLLVLNPADGWNELLNKVTEREVNQIWGVGFEASDLRHYIEGLASKARTLGEGRGLEDSDLEGVFKQVFGRDTDKPANLLTMRLPGLGSVPGRPGAREFIDLDFADAAASGDLGRYVASPFNAATALEGAVRPIGDLGRQIAANHVGGSVSRLSVALAQSSRHETLSATFSDIISMLIDQSSGYDGEQIQLHDASFQTVSLEPEYDFSKITFNNCIFSTLELGRVSKPAEGKNFPTLFNCLVDKLEGASSQADVPPQLLFGTTTVETYAAYTATNGAVMRTTLPDPVKVLLTILRKLFMQRGTGRQYGALRRGLPVGLTHYVDPIISQVKAKGFAEDVRLDRHIVLIPNRARSSDALAIINGPNTSTHPLIEAVKLLL